MQLTVNTPKKSLNRAFLKEKVSRTDIERFKQQLISLFDKTDDTYSEDTLKDFVTEFLRKTWYDPSYAITINTNRKDLSIHSGKSPNDAVTVITEVKRIGSQEMLSESKINVKAFHELVLYYLRERDAGNISIKNLVATDVYQWFIFDANEFDKKIYTPRIKKLFDIHKIDEKNNPFFYEELKKILGETSETITCTYINIQKFQGKILDDNKDNDNDLIPIYKILSPEHLLKQPFANDSNSLDKKFYDELLYLIGLEEKKDANSNKRIIDRKDPSKRSSGSLIENTISKLRSKDCLYDVPNAKRFGDEEETQLYNLALELCITWINRILFLKLLEAQLFSYHKQKKFLFLSSDLIFDYDELNNLFFQVLAELPESRELRLKDKFEHVPYLNSSLFERTKLERITIDVSALDNRQLLPLFNNTVLKDGKGRKLTGELSALEYLLRFLDSYDFTSEGKSEIQEENKTLINASVLGLIFEKINGYKDGSFFTPGFITMYMSKETLRKGVVRRFNAIKGWSLKSFDELYDKIEDRYEANKIVNSLTICDPAVGSGHFLVSALNELIAIKAELKILQDRKGKRLKEYNIEVINDELIITDEEGEPFEYKPSHPESQRVQEAIFHEKEELIEKCLFGVDINANSVKICRLRLWIELLKNAYYSDKSNYKYLETLPNIDINIKEGNSLVSRFSLNTNLSEALKNTDWTIEQYKTAVTDYKEAKGKKQKRELEDLIANIKNDFRREINVYDPVRKKLSKKRGELQNQTHTIEMFQDEKKVTKKKLKEIEKLKKEVEELENEIKEVENNKIYENAFEWRFEFPEILDNDGNFLGFDAVIGNPPYKMIQPHNTSKQELTVFKRLYPFADFKIDLFHLFFQLGNFISKEKGSLGFIAPSTLLYNYYTDDLRLWISDHFQIDKIVVTKKKVFSDADVHTAIYFFEKSTEDKSDKKVLLTTELENVLEDKASYKTIRQKEISETPGNVWNLLVDSENVGLIKKMATNKTLEQVAQVNRGLITGDRDRYFSTVQTDDRYVPILTGSDIFKYYNLEPSEFVLFERPKTAGGCWDKEVHFAPHKICVRQIGFEPTATLITEPIAVTGNIFTVITSDLAYSKCLLAVLNSKAVKYFWQIMFNDFKSSFPQVTIFSLSHVPIPEIDDEAKDKLVLLVDSILFEKQNDHSADLSNLTKGLNDIVNKLFDLDESESDIIEKFTNIQAN